MDTDRFDAVVRTLAGRRSRRGVAHLLGGLSLGGVMSLVGIAATDAKHKHKHKKTPAPPAPATGCVNNCEQRICGDNGCGGSRGTCEADQVCANGRCASSCPGGQKVCASRTTSAARRATARPPVRPAVAGNVSTW